MKTVKVSGWVAKLAWDQTVGGTLCPIATDWVTARSQFGGGWFWLKSTEEADNLGCVQVNHTLPWQEGLGVSGELAESVHDRWPEKREGYT